MKTQIAKDIERAGAMIQYDTQCKKVLSNKYILAWIMEAVVEEYACFSRHFIRRCIEDEPEVGTVYVEPGQYTKDKIEGLNTEDKDVTEHGVTYDIRFATFVPKDLGRMKIIINVEAQRNFHPGYPILSRGIYYDARMISSQNGVEFEEPYYGDIKKVYSIWVCSNSPNYIGNAISIYDIQKRDIVGKAPEDKLNYDKMSVVMIYLNPNVPRKKGFFDVMNTLLSPTMDIERKKYILWNEYQIPMEKGYVKEVDLMCNLSEWVLETGMDIRERQIVDKMLKKKISDDFIMDLLEISKEKLDEIKEQLMAMV